MSENQPKNIETYLRGIEIQRIGNRAVRRAQEENRRRGIPNVYSRNGKLFFELPDGNLTDETATMRP
jgi:hypothetical protein